MLHARWHLDALTQAQVKCGVRTWSLGLAAAKNPDKKSQRSLSCLSVAPCIPVSPCLWCPRRHLPTSIFFFFHFHNFQRFFLLFFEQCVRTCCSRRLRADEHSPHFFQCLLRDHPLLVAVSHPVAQGFVMALVRLGSLVPRPQPAM